MAVQNLMAQLQETLNKYAKVDRNAFQLPHITTSQDYNSSELPTEIYYIWNPSWALQILKQNEKGCILRTITGTAGFYSEF